jgi:hypothetical protein
MSRAWIASPRGRLGVAAALLLLAAGAVLCLADGHPADHGAPLVGCAGAAVLPLLAVWLAGLVLAGRVLAPALLSAGPLALPRLDPPPKLAVC